MRTVADDLAAVLRGLGEVDAPEGMERRVLARLAKPERQQADRGGASWAWRRWVLAGTVAGGLAVAAWFALPARHAAESGEPAQRVAGLRPARETAARRAVVTGEVGRTRKGAPVRSRAASAPSRAARQTAEAGGPAAEGMVVPTEAQMLADARAASFPVPSEPLTGRERLLLRVVRKGDPAEMDALDPVHRDERREAERVEIAMFFEPKLDTNGEERP